MIPAVALQDLGWLLLLLAIRRLAPTPYARKLLTVMSCYVVVELFFHYWMEESVAWAFLKLGL